MLSIFSRPRYFDKDGNFNNKKFIDLMYKARKKLQKQMQRSGGADRFSFEQFNVVLGGIAEKEVWQFINKLSSFQNSGVDLKTSLAMLHKQVKSPKLRIIVNALRTNLEYGLSLSETLRQYARYFNPLVISLLEIGEKTGTLPKVLIELDDKLLENLELKRRIKSAMIYPAILVCMTIVMVIFMLVFIIPKISETFAKSHVALPWLTQTVVDISDFIRGHYIVLILSIFAMVVGFLVFRASYIGRMVLGRIALVMPVFGHVNRFGNIILFINSLGLLLDSGILMIPALDITADIVPSMYFKRDIIRIKNEMESGIKLSTAMGLFVSQADSVYNNPYFTEDLVQMILVGEETGTVSKTISKIGVNYSKELRAYIGNIMTMLEPFILVFVGILVGIIVVAIMLPFFNLGKVVKAS